MEDLNSYKNARKYFKRWAPERQKVLDDLKTFRDEIQRQARIHSIGSITYSSVGLVGGGLTIAGIIAAPFTFGASLGLTIAGVATGVTSGVAGLTHGLVKIGIVKSQCTNAKTSLENHDAACRKMKALIILLKEDIETIEANIKEIQRLQRSQALGGATASLSALGVGGGIANLVKSSQATAVYRITGNADEVARMLSLGTALDDIVPSALKDVSKGVTKLSTEALSVIAAVGIIIDLGSLIWNAVDLAKIEQGKLCAEAEKLDNVIQKMQHEYDVLKEYFN